MSSPQPCFLYALLASTLTTQHLSNRVRMWFVASVSRPAPVATSGALKDSEGYTPRWAPDAEQTP